LCHCAYHTGSGLQPRTRSKNWIGFFLPPALNLASEIACVHPILANTVYAASNSRQSVSHVVPAIGVICQFGDVQAGNISKSANFAYLDKKSFFRVNT
jgi:hypothetical protein